MTSQTADGTTGVGRSFAGGLFFMTHSAVGCLVLALTILACCFAIYIALFVYSNGTYELARVDCGQGREIVITANRSWEISQPINYYVRVSGETVVDSTFLDAQPADVDLTTLKFVLHSANDGNLVGIVYSEDSTDYLVVHDFKNNESWPHGDRLNGSLRQQLEAQLNSAHSEGGL